MQEMQQMLLDFPRLWAHADNDEKRQILLLLLEKKGLRIDRNGRDILMSIKLHLMPERQRTIIYHTFRGINRAKKTPEQTLTKTQMLQLLYEGRGKTRKEAAELMGCKPSSLYTTEKTIRKNLGGVTWAQAIEMTRERVEANAAQLLPRVPRGSGKKAEAEVEIPFLSPLLMEVFVLFAQGATTGEVAEELGLQIHTVQGRRKRILQAFKTKSMLEAVRKAHRDGILPK
jgi:DNA-binding CsgD family transcriptional regulator